MKTGPGGTSTTEKKRSPKKATVAAGGAGSSSSSSTSNVRGTAGANAGPQKIGIAELQPSTAASPPPPAVQAQNQNQPARRNTNWAQAFELQGKKGAFLVRVSNADSSGRLAGGFYEVWAEDGKRLAHVVNSKSHEIVCFLQPGRMPPKFKFCSLEDARPSSTTSSSSAPVSSEDYLRKAVLVSSLGEKSTQAVAHFVRRVQRNFGVDELRLFGVFGEMGMAGIATASAPAVDQAQISTTASGAGGGPQLETHCVRLQEVVSNFKAGNIGSSNGTTKSGMRIILPGANGVTSSTTSDDSVRCLGHLAEKRTPLLGILPSSVRLGALPRGVKEKREWADWFVSKGGDLVELDVVVEAAPAEGTTKAAGDEILIFK
eukprot:g972.t1